MSDKPVDGLPAESSGGPTITKMATMGATDRYRLCWKAGSPLAPGADGSRVLTLQRQWECIRPGDDGVWVEPYWEDQETVYE